MAGEKVIVWDCKNVVRHSFMACIHSGIAKTFNVVKHKKRTKTGYTSVSAQKENEPWLGDLTSVFVRQGNVLERFLSCVLRLLIAHDSMSSFLLIIS